MENKMKRFLSLTLAILMVFSMMPQITLGASAAEMTGGEKLYLKPNSNWTYDGARFAIYVFGSSGNAWVSMTDSDGDGIYEATVPSGSWTNVIFCRMNPSATANNWNNKWNQSGDLVYDGTNNLCTINDGQWDCGTNVTWSEYTYVAPTYTVAGAAGLCGTAWDPANTDNDMTDNGDGTYTKVFTNIEAGTFEYKVVRDHSWDASWGDGDSNATVTTNYANNTVTITFNGSSVSATVTCGHTYEYACSTECHDCGEGEREASHASDANPLDNLPYGFNCVDGGSVNMTCKYCNQGYTAVIEATEHKYSDGVCNICKAMCDHEGVVPAYPADYDCTTTYTLIATCSCGRTWDVEVTGNESHDFGEDGACQTPNCTVVESNTEEVAPELTEELLTDTWLIDWNCDSCDSSVGTFGDEDGVTYGDVTKNEDGTYTVVFTIVTESHIASACHGINNDHPDYNHIFENVPETATVTATWNAETKEWDVAPIVYYATCTEIVEETYVAYIDEQGYTTLQKAFDAVVDGQTITLAENITIDENSRYTLNGYYEGAYYDGDASFTIDLDGKTITNVNGDVNDYLLLFKNAGSKANTINIKNGTINSDGTYSAICTSGGSTQQITINLDDVTVTNTRTDGYGDVLRVRGGAVMNINDGVTVTGKGVYVSAYSVKATVNIYDGAEIYMNETISYVGAVVGASNGGTVNAYGGYGKGTQGCFIVMTTGGTINVSGGEWIADSKGTGNDGNHSVLIAQNSTYEENWAANSIINVTGGTFTGKYNCYGVAAGDSAINITAGNFSTDPSAYVVGYNMAVLNDEGTYDVVEKPDVAKIGDTGYKTFEEALAAASAMSGDVTVTILDKVTLNSSLSGSYDSITFVGGSNTAEIYLDVQGYITAAGKDVSFKNLTLSKAQGGFITNAGFMNVAFGVYNVNSVNYTNCVFTNGAYASSGEVTFTDCTFYRSWDKYGLWAYGDADITVDDCTFDDYRGIKMYAENAAKTTALTVKNTDFSALTGKPAIVLTYGESVVLEGNTYSSTGTFELDQDGAPNGTPVTSDVAPVCVNDDGACGVLVDGKIYTSVADAVAVATAESEITVLYSTDEEAEFPFGATLTVAEGVSAPNVTVALPAAAIGETKYATLAEAVNAAGANDTITLLADIEETASVTVNKTLTLDLNGHTITNATTAPITIDGGTLTVKDSSKAQTGAIVASSTSSVNDDKAAILFTSNVGKFVLESGSLKSSKYGIRSVSSASEIEINGGAIDADSYGIIAYSGDVTFNGGKITSGFYGVAAYGTFTMNDGTIEALCGYTSAGTWDETVAVINGGELIGTVYNGIYWPSAGSLTINGGTITGVNGVHVRSGSLSITGGTITGTGEGETALTIENIGGESGYQAVENVEIIGGTFVSTNGPAVTSITDTTGSNPDSVAVTNFIYGGTYSSAIPADYCADGYVPTSYVENGVTVYGVKAEIEAKIGKKSYVTLAAAIAAAQDGDTILLQADVYVDTVIEISKNITIADYQTYSITTVGDGAFHITGTTELTLDEVIVNASVYADSNTAGATVNGQTVNGVAGEMSTVVSDGETVTVTNPAWVADVNGTVYYTDVAAAVAAAATGDTVNIYAGTYTLPALKNKQITVIGETNEDGAAAVILEGTIEGTLENLTLKNVHIKAGNAMRWAYAKGDVTFENVTLEATSVYAIHFDDITEGANITVKNCTIIGWVAMGGSPASFVFDGCTIKDNGAYGLIRSYFDTTITNCTFDVDGANTADAFPDGIQSCGTATITVEDCTNTNTNGDMIDLINVHKMAIVELDGETIWNVATIGDTYYRTVAAAIAAAEAGDTITLVRDVNEDVTVNKSLTIDGAEKNYTGNISATGTNSTIEVVVKNVNFVDGTGYAITTNRIKSITVEDCTVTGYTKFGFLYANKSTPTVNVKNVTVDGAYYGMHWVYGTNATLENVKMTNVTYGLMLQNYGAKTVTLKNCSISGTNALNVWERIGYSAVQTFKFEGATSVTGDISDVAALVLNATDATLTAAEGETVTSGVDRYVVVYEDGAYKLIKPVAKIGDSYYETVAEALTAAVNGDTIELIWAEGDAAIPMNGTLCGNKTVTITGTATVDWDAGWLFIGRGGEGDGTLIFQDANITSDDQGLINSFGPNVSGATSSSTTNNGKLIIKDSTVEIDYLATRNTVEVDNSTVTIMGGLSIAGRGTAESTSGNNDTALIDLKNGSTMTVNFENTMGFGWESDGGIGRLVIDATSTYHAKRELTVGALGYVVVNGGNLIVDGTLTNGGFVTTTAATMKVNNLVNNRVVQLYGSSTVQVEKLTRGDKGYFNIRDGAVLNNSYIKGNVNLYGNVTFNGGFECVYMQTSNTCTITIEEDTTVKATYGVNCSASCTLNGGTLEVSMGDTNWGLVFQNNTYVINSNIVVNGNGKTAPIHFTNATATINGTITQTNSNGEPMYIGTNSVVTLGKTAEIDVLSIYGAGKLIIDAQGMTAGEYANVKCTASGFTGELQVINNNELYAQIIDGKIHLVAYVAMIGEVGYATLQEAIDAAVDGDTVLLMTDCDEDVTIVQKADLDLIIDGNGNTYSGTMTIHGQARYEGEETLTIQNVKFETGEAGHYFIDSNSTGSVERYAHNVTVQNCSFTATGDAVKSAAAMRIRQGFNISIIGCTATDMHSVLQGYGIAGVTVDGLTATGMKNGISLGTSTNVTVNDATIEADGYGIRADGEGAYGPLTVTESIISAQQPIVVRKTAAAYMVNVDATNTLNAAEGFAQVTYTAGDDGTQVAPEVTVDMNVAETFTVFPESEAKIGNTHYASVEAALNAAQAGDTVALVTDAEVESLILLKGINLDLAGKTLTVSSHVAAFAGNNIIDSVSGGLLKVNKDTVLIQKANTYLPIWDATNGGYAFATLTKTNIKVTPGDDSYHFMFLPRLAFEHYELLAQGAAASGVTMKVEASWVKVADDGSELTSSLIFAYSDELMESFYNAIDLETGKYGATFSLTLTGTADKTITFRVFFESDTGVILNCN